MKFLKNHPFPVEAHFKCSTVLTFAVPKEELQGLIPECLTLDTFQDQWAFIAVAMVETRNLRPKGIPAFLGNDFILVGYRIFVKYNTSLGKRLRGLYIIKSETNRRKMEILGNIFTHYNYSTTDIQIKSEDERKSILSKKSNFELQINTHSTEANLPQSSPFSEWKEARRFAGPLPFTFTYDETNKSVLIIQGVRTKWKPQPIEVTHYRFKYLEQLGLEGLILANAFEINDVPYHWKKGKKDQWT